MRRRNWKRVAPNSLKEAMRLGVEYARERRHHSVDHVADLMGLSSRDTLYKWLSTGRMPATYIRPFEHLCGIDLVTQYMATSAYKLLIDIPAGRAAKDTDLISLQSGFADAMGLLAKFYQGDAGADETISALTAVLSDIASHRANVSQTQYPELNMFDGGDR